MATCFRLVRFGNEGVLSRKMTQFPNGSSTLDLWHWFSRNNVARNGFGVFRRRGPPQSQTPQCDSCAFLFPRIDLFFHFNLTNLKICMNFWTPLMPIIISRQTIRRRECIECMYSKCYCLCSPFGRCVSSVRAVLRCWKIKSCLRLVRNFFSHFSPSPSLFLSFFFVIVASSRGFVFMCVCYLSSFCSFVHRRCRIFFGCSAAVPMWCCLLFSASCLAMGSFFLFSSPFVVHFSSSLVSSIRSRLIALACTAIRVVCVCVSKFEMHTETTTDRRRRTHRTRQHQQSIRIDRWRECV